MKNKKSKLKRFGVSMDEKLLEKFDSYIECKGYNNRSEALRDLVRDALIQHSWSKDDNIVAGNIMLYYNHHKRNLSEAITTLQHDCFSVIVSTSHYHVTHENCMETIIVRGKAKDVQKLKDGLMSLKGVFYVKEVIVNIDQI